MDKAKADTLFKYPLRDNKKDGESIAAENI